MKFEDENNGISKLKSIKTSDTELKSQILSVLQYSSAGRQVREIDWLIY